MDIFPSFLKRFKLLTPGFLWILKLSLMYISNTGNQSKFCTINGYRGFTWIHFTTGREKIDFLIKKNFFNEVTQKYSKKMRADLIFI